MYAVTEKAKRDEIAIAGIKVEVFMLPDGTYVMSQSQMGKACGVNKMSVSRFLASDALKTLLGKPPSVSRFKFHDTECNGNLNRVINAHTLDVVILFWMSQSEKSNLKAKALVYACAMESLERRCDRIFRVRKTEQEYEDNTSANFERLWSQARVKHESVQGAYNNFCQGNGLNPKAIHNWISEEITGMTASEQRRRLSLVGDNDQLGVDHIQHPHQLELIAETKLVMLGLKLDMQKIVKQCIDKARERLIEFE